jgi:hypothetical protein
MNNFEELLQGEDLRSLGESNKIISLVTDQNTFDELFKYLYSDRRNIKMKIIDVIEKITLKENIYLQKHKNEIINFAFNAQDIEFKWHIAQIAGRLKYTKKETENVFNKLMEWVLNKNESKIVRVNSIQSLYELTKDNEELGKKFFEVIQNFDEESVPSIKARIKKIMNN